MTPYDFSAQTPPVVTEAQLRGILARRREWRLVRLAALVCALWLTLPVALYFRLRDAYPALALGCLLAAGVMALVGAALVGVCLWKRRSAAWQASLSYF